MIFNIFNCRDNKIIENRCLIRLDMNIMLHLYKFNLRVSVDHHEHSMDCGHYTASIYCCGKKHWNGTKIIECSIGGKHNSSTACILLYKFIVYCIWSDSGGWKLIDSHGAGTFAPPIITGRGVGTETCEVDNMLICFLLMTSALVRMLTLAAQFYAIYIKMSIWWDMWFVYRCLTDGGGRSNMACHFWTLVVLYRMLATFTWYEINDVLDTVSAHIHPL